MPATKQLVDNLAKLPIELAGPIINDLRVWDVTKILLWNNPTVNSYMLANPSCRTLFGEDSEAFSASREQLQAYINFVKERNLVIHVPKVAFLRRSLFDLRDEQPDETRPDWRLIDPIHMLIWNKTPAWKADLIRLYVKNPNQVPDLTWKSSLESFKTFWDLMVEAKVALRSQCAQQVLRTADLLEKNPDLLKRTLDPEQKRRPNTLHTVTHMRTTANKILRSRDWEFRGSEAFKYESFPVIPFDDVLERLVQWMEKHKMTADKNVLAGDQHLPAIMELVRVVVDGMPYIYPLDPARATEDFTCSYKTKEGDVLRTENTPWSGIPKDVEKSEDGPIRFVPDMGAPAWQFLRERAWRGLEPHGEKEEEWVKAFVELYRYLEKLERT